ncbi:hypothetical protein CGRA01v4_02044 [Colletotrichum graminicola]|uniref:Tim17/Tim22/Tim23 family protein n=1 Tax=Colletotrichum graminicola (strain M1.001 / M2 / FGSC 10212) TaxID=645133 RepID=E3QS22_COLGM|nr:uncharacterized protein GLRG_08589 [Colletotrichum graminicola M1.001]EFQ33660.1 hypothetical protein GLRG_08589 [Colletotrichum graminicola M1.001]WDK10765.1 hypothetical protein CGRA01v4_02044 [Colletotrichum graminicola]
MAERPEVTMAENLSFGQNPSESRLSIPTPARIPLAGIVGFGIGATLGLAHGGRTAQLRFRAEHAHKMPTTTTGWYLYHKSKNYHAMRGGIREGLRMGCKLSFWTLMAFGLESTVDRYRGKSDLLSTVLASLTVAGSFSLWNRFSLPTAARTARYGLLFGLVYGGMQDAVGLARGRSVGYVDFIRRRFGSNKATKLDQQQAS